MSRIRPEQGLKPSILDRLVDPESSGTQWRQGYGLQQTISVIRWDLEELLNTRQATDGPPGLSTSIYGFGLPELTSLQVITTDQKHQLGELLANTISYFEPRLRDIHVELIVSENEHEQQRLAFRINARLAVEPFDDVSFRTMLEMTTGCFSVQQS